jgi:hypothetical protein
VQFFLTSPPDVSYNCIAWAAGDSSRWWWPGRRPFAYWPKEVPDTPELSSFVAMFESLGYQPCADGSLERSREKVAVFIDASGAPTHAARQLSSGHWTSKMGKVEDISHSIYGLEGGAYGSVSCYLSRPRNESE